MQPSSLFVFLLLTTVIICLIGSASSIARIRYVNSMPQFGKATVKSIPPFTTLFNGVAGGTLTAYVNFTTVLSVLITQYPTNVTALSLPYLIDFTKYYSLFTFQIQSRHVGNVLVEDRQTSLIPSKPAIRCINLLQYNFPLDVFNLSNSAQIFDNVTYGVPTTYISVPPGDYSLYWESSSAKKKRQDPSPTSNSTRDPVLFPGLAYTHWVLPSGSFIVRDGSLVDAISTTKRMVSSSSIRERRNKIKEEKEGQKLKGVVKKSEEKEKNEKLEETTNDELITKSNKMREIVENKQLALKEKIAALNGLEK